MAFVTASRKRAYLKLALSGSSGSGKTMSALRLARGLTDGAIAVADTENRSSSLYAGHTLLDPRTGKDYKVAFDVDDIAPPYTSDAFIRSITEAKKAGYEVLVIDSFSHVWEAVLKYKETLDSVGGNSYTNWANAGKKFSEVLDLVRSIDMHIIVCMRAKMEYVLEVNERGKSVPRKVGLAPIVRDGTEYEFSTMFEIDMTNHARDTKGRLRHITGGEPLLLTEEVGAKLREWVNEGEPAPPPPEQWTAEKKAHANSLYKEWKANGGDDAPFMNIKNKNLPPSDTITELMNLIKGATK